MVDSIFLKNQNFVHFSISSELDIAFYDIGLIINETAIEFNDNVQPICLPNQVNYH